jgi:hypothetical protein
MISGKKGISLGMFISFTLNTDLKVDAKIEVNYLIFLENEEFLLLTYARICRIVHICTKPNGC